MRWLMLTALTIPGAAWAQDGDAAAGQALAQRWCASCHTTDARPAAAADAAPAFAAIAARPGVTADGLRAFLAEPHGRMPNLSLSRNDIANLVAHLMAVKGK